MTDLPTTPAADRAASRGYDPGASAQLPASANPAQRTVIPPLVIAGETLSSRLILGSGGFDSMAILGEACAASETAMVTVAMRRVDPTQQGSLIDVLDRAGVRVLPNTAGCFTAREAVRTAQLAREALQTDWVKLEVIGEDRTLLPDGPELLPAAAQLVALGLAVPPLGSPIGTGRGIANPVNIALIAEQAGVRVVLDAGIGTASEATQAIELGGDAGVLASGGWRGGDP